MLSLLIDAYERRDIETADAVGAYLTTGMTDNVILILAWESVNLIYKVNKTCQFDIIA